MKDPEPSDNIFPNKSLGIHVPDICQWFSFNLLSEIVPTSKYLLVPTALKGFTMSKPH